MQEKELSALALDVIAAPSADPSAASASAAASAAPAATAATAAAAAGAVEELRGGLGILRSVLLTAPPLSEAWAAGAASAAAEIGAAAAAAGVGVGGRDSSGGDGDSGGRVDGSGSGRLVENAGEEKEPNSALPSLAQVCLLVIFCACTRCMLGLYRFFCSGTVGGGVTNATARRNRQGHARTAGRAQAFCTSFLHTAHRRMHTYVLAHARLPSVGGLA